MAIRRFLASHVFQQACQCEMPLAVLQERLSSLAAGNEKTPPPENLAILAADYFRDGLPNLGTVERGSGRSTISWKDAT